MAEEPASWRTARAGDLVEDHWHARVRSRGKVAWCAALDGLPREARLGPLSDERGHLVAWSPR